MRVFAQIAGLSDILVYNDYNPYLPDIFAGYKGVRIYSTFLSLNHRLVEEMSIDVDKEKKELKEYIQTCVARFDSEDPVGFIQLGFQTTQAGLFSIFFDSSKDAGPDGSWTLHLADNSFPRDHWEELVEADEENVSELAQIMADAFIEARDDGILDSLPMTKDCDFGIEEFDGIFGWPEYDERKKVNLVRDTKL